MNHLDTTGSVSVPTPSATPSLVVSGMRPTGLLHLGHYHGALKNWVALQETQPCYFFVADWHALTTHYQDPRVLATSTWDMVIDWLAAGIDPEKAHIFIQSRIPEHAELHTLLSMSTPLSWLERVPTYKDQQDKLKDKDLSTYGFLGYPLLQAADVLIYRATTVPVGEDQAPHVEMMREIARRFNNLYGKETGYEDKALEAVKLLGSDTARRFKQVRKYYQETGKLEALAEGHNLINAASLDKLGLDAKARLAGYLEGTGKSILTEPVVSLTKDSKLPGLDGAKMSKSYHNTIALRELPADIEAKILKMPTDPARKLRSDSGSPELCPVWKFHQVYSNADTQAWVKDGCTTAGIGCVDCKRPVIAAVQAELAPMRERAMHFAANPNHVRGIIAAGCDAARKTAQATMHDVRAAMGLLT
jgi:tryptophanyl-tRNA synthetase